MGNLLLEFDEMYEALSSRNSEYDGVIFFGVRTTGVFCRVTCAARKPNRENVAFFESTADAIRAGFRPCKRCNPMAVSGKMPDWLQPVIERCQQEPGRNWKDDEIRDLGVEPRRVRRWFLTQYGITFHHFLRGRRLAQALQQISLGQDISTVASEAGYESESGFRTAFQQWFSQNPGQSQQLGPPLLFNRLVSPLGPLVMVSDEDHVFLLEFADRKKLDTQFQALHRLLQRPLVPGSNRLMELTQRQLEEYFHGSREQFDLPLGIHGTEFQMSVWKQLLQIDYGRTASYEEVARKIGRPQGQRAVGRANGDNRIAILIPCHRVIRQDGSLSGYGGGVRRKEWMLDHENAWARRRGVGPFNQL